MKNKLKYSLFLLTCVLAISVYGAVAVPDPPNPPKLVNDYLNLLTPEQQQALENKLVAYDDSTHNQIAIVIVARVESDGQEEATTIGDKWGVGQKGKDNGVVMLIAIESRKTFIASGRGVEDVLPDATCKHIWEYEMKPFFKSGNYYDGINAGVDQIIQKVGSRTPEQRAADQKQEELNQRIRRAEFFDTLSWVVGIILFFVSLFGLGYWIYQKNKRVNNQVNHLRTFYQNILADEVTLDSKWPRWAEKAFKEKETAYSNAKRLAESAIKKLPRFFITRLFTNESKLVPIQETLNAYDTIDREITKIRDDAKLYSERAAPAIAEVKQTYQETLKMISDKDQDHNFTKEIETVKQLGEKINRLQITDEDSKRDCFLAALAAVELLMIVKNSAQAEFDAQTAVKKSITDFTNRAAGLSKTLEQYSGHMKTLAAYPTTASADLDTVDVLQGRISRAQDLLANLINKVQGNTPGKYQDAANRVQTLEELFTKISSHFSAAGTRIEALQVKQKAYPHILSQVEAVVAKAEREVKDSDVETSTQRTAQEARSLLANAQRLANAPKVDWLLVCQELENAEQKAKKAINSADDDKSAASRRRSSNYSSLSTTSSYDGGWSSGSSSGGGFGGFGGGSFGGGGSGGSW